MAGRAELATDPRFAERQGRLDRRAALKAELESALAAKPALDWERELNAAGVPAGRVLTVPEALAAPQLSDRGMIGTFKDVPGVGRDIRVVRTGFKVDGAPPKVDRPPPRLGEHTRALLAELGYSAEDIDRLAEEKAI